MSISEPNCPSCELGNMRLRGVAGRRATALPGVEVELDSTLELPTCDHCLAYSVPEALEQKFEEALQDGLREWQKDVVAGWVNLLCARHGITRRRIAAALDVTPAYLSNITSGAKAASSMLLRLLRAYVLSPMQLADVLHGRPIEAMSTQQFEGDAFLAMAAIPPTAAKSTKRQATPWLRRDSFDQPLVDITANNENSSGYDSEPANILGTPEVDGGARAA